MVHGRLPFDNTQHDLLDLIVSTEPVYDHCLSAELLELLRSMMCKDPEIRCSAKQILGSRWLSSEIPLQHMKKWWGSRSSWDSVTDWNPDTGKQGETSPIVHQPKRKVSNITSIAVPNFSKRPELRPLVPVKYRPKSLLRRPPMFDILDKP
jgi:serine/threonine protein kinase